MSVVIPTYNRAAVIMQALQSCLDQLGDDYDIWIVDDGSTDETKSLLGSVSDPRLHYVCQPNGGASAARNLGLKVSSSAYVAFLDSDDIAEWRRLSRQATFLDLRPDIGAVFSDVLKVYPDGDEQRFSETLPMLRKSVARHRDGDQAVIPQREMYRLVVAENPVKPSSLMVRRAALPDGPVFDARLDPSEGFDLMLRLASRWGFGYIDQALVRHRVWRDSIHLSQPEQAYRGAIEALRRQLSPGSERVSERRVLRHGLANQHWMYGRHRWRSGDRAGALRAFRAAFRWYPRPAFLAYASAALMPRTLVQRFQVICGRVGQDW